MLVKEYACMNSPRGRAKGGIARAEALSPKTRKEIAKKAAAARWDSDVPTATHIGELEIGDLKLPCAVLPDGTRVISQGGVTTAFGPVTGGYQQRQRAADEEMEGLPSFLVAKSLQAFISPELRNLVSAPRKYRDPRGGPIRVGFEAGLLPKVCEVWLQARDADALTKIQKPVADRADLLMRGLAHIGIIALVDEATGYQRDRAKDALTRILEAFIAKELQPWLRTFPDDFYQEMFRLRDMEYPDDTVQRPRYFGLLTNDIVYDRLAPGVLEELKQRNPKSESGRRRHKYFQWLTTNKGYPKLREHLGAVVAIMKLSADWHDFRAKLDRLYPSYKKPTQLSLEFADDEPDTGKGL
jgi:P63C domain